MADCHYSAPAAEAEIHAGSDVEQSRRGAG